VRRRCLPQSRRQRYVAEANAYPGIDAIYRVDASSGELELDFAVHAGANPAALQLVASQGTRFEPETATGDIIAANADTRFRLKAPVAFQWIDGVRTPVAVRFELAANAVRFAALSTLLPANSRASPAAASTLHLWFNRSQSSPHATRRGQ
jgi:hypothetical protein